MTKPLSSPVASFTSDERDYVRRELGAHFSTPRVADGFRLTIWRGGPRAGQAKLPAPAQSMAERGLMRLDTSGRLPRMLFTDAGLAELRTMMSDGRLANPARFAHVREELGIDPPVMPGAGT
jgi:hypothetical protein